MDEHTLNAIKGSITKWEGIVAGTTGDEGVKNCPLCKEFWIMDCAGCPVATKTEMIECEGTPYKEWSDDSNWHSGMKAETPRQKQLAQEMLDFLKSLLPEKAQ